MLATAQPAVIAFHEAPKKIACGLYHTACISDQEHGQLLKENHTYLYSWGRNTHGPLGQGDKTEQLTPAKAIQPENEVGDLVHGDLNYYEVACGNCHSLVLVRASEGHQLYTCGLRAAGRLGQPPRRDTLDQERTFIPVIFKKEFSEHTILRICCGADHSLCLSLAGVVFAWGANGEGQCGVGLGRGKEVLQPMPLADFPRQRTGELAQVKHLAAGARHSLMVTCDAGTPGGSLYTWGCNQQCRLGLGHVDNQFSPALVRTITEAHVMAAAGGEAHSGAIDSDKKLWMWGVGANGRLGLGDTVDVRIPRRVRLPEDVAVLQIALGTFHSAALCVSNKKRLVFTWGCGEALGLLNEGDTTVVAVPRLVEIMDPSDPDFSHHNVLQIAAGPYHTVLLQENGDIVAFGQGASGRLGTGKTKNFGRPKRIGPYGFALRPNTATADSKVVRSLKHKSESRSSKGNENAAESHELWELRQVACGDMHSAALTFGGELYTWGSSENGQLGFGDREDSWVPQLLSFNKKVLEIAVGTYHCLAMTMNGDVYSWGKGENGQLGLGRNEDTLVPKKINEIKDAQTISAGDEHSAAICRMHAATTNLLWTWGSTHSGKLGVADCFSVATAPPTQVEEFRGLEERPSPVAVSCGHCHTAVICYDQSTNRKRVFTFGGGWHGRLGHNRLENEYVPKLVEGLEPCALQVACGSGHTCIIAKPDVLEKASADDDQAGAGYLWVWGKAHVVCEHKDLWTPKKFAHVDSKFVSVVCAAEHSLAITATGEVYAWGDNSNGQLGQLVTVDNPDGDMLPKLTRLPPKPRLLATGPEHTISVFQDKDTYCWGNQRGGRLGLSEKTPWKVVDRPTKVDAKWASVEAIGQTADKAEEGGEEDRKAEEEEEEEGAATAAGGGKQDQPLLYWWREHLDLLERGKWQVSEVGTFKVDSVSDVEGEAFVADLRGVKSNMFDLKVHFNVTFLQEEQQQLSPRSSRRSRRSIQLKSLVDQQLVQSGQVQLMDFSSIAAKSGKPFTAEVKNFSPEAEDLVMEHFFPLLQKELNALVKLFHEKKVSDETNKREQPDSNKRMLQAIAANSQKIALFSTMQALLKNEPEDAKMPALRALEEKLNKDLSVYFDLISKLPEKEDRVVKLQFDFEQSFTATLKYIKKLPAPDVAGQSKSALSEKLNNYQELLWILQQQAFYLGTLSMFLGPGDDQTFEDAVACIFAEKDDQRTQNLFLVLLKVIIFKEIEQAKSLKELFREEGKVSRVFRLLGSFALDKVHYKEVVHPVMDSTNPESLIGRVVDLANQGQVIAFTPAQYQEFPQHKDRLKDYDVAEIKNEFNSHSANVRKFFRSDFVQVLKGYRLPQSLLKMFDYTVREIKKRQFPDATSSTDISAEMMLYSPILYLYVMGVLVPMMRDPQKFAGNEVFLSASWREAGLEEDVTYNLNNICELLEATMVNDERELKGKDFLAQIAKTSRPELLKFVMDQVADATDDTDTLVTIDLYLSHFDRRPHTVSISAATLMKLSNLLRRNLSKLRLNQDDALERLCENIGLWSDEDIRSTEGKDFFKNFVINTRWLFQEKTMVICPTSHCPVPPRFSTESETKDDGDEGSKTQLLMPFYPEKQKYGDVLVALENLFIALDMVKSDNFDGLIAEIRQKQAEYRAKSDFHMAEKLQKGIQQIEMVVNIGVEPVDLLEWMASAVNERDLRRRYLEDVKREITALRWAEKKHGRDLVEAESQLSSALEMSRSVTVPPTMVKETKAAGQRCKLEAVGKHMEGLDELGRKGIENCSYSPMITKSLQQLRRERIVKEVDPWLESIERAGGYVHLTFVLTERGLDITVTVSRVKFGRTIKSNVRYLRIPDEKVQDLHRAQEEAVFDLPEDKPLVKVMTMNLASMLGKLAKS